MKLEIFVCEQDQAGNVHWLTHWTKKWVLPEGTSLACCWCVEQSKIVILLGTERRCFLLWWNILFLSTWIFTCNIGNRLIGSHLILGKRHWTNWWTILNDSFSEWTQKNRITEKTIFICSGQVRLVRLDEATKHTKWPGKESETGRGRWCSADITMIDSDNVLVPSEVVNWWSCYAVQAQKQG